MKKDKLIEESIPRCPKCNSKTTVGVIASYDNIKEYKAKKCYFCSECLIEFDSKHVKLFDQNGNSVENIAI